jgi:hypothetical protein
MRPERVTVVIITRNRREELLGTLEHMTTLPDRAPVVVVDNGSTDHTSDARPPTVRAGPGIAQRAQPGGGGPELGSITYCHAVCGVL